jgi:hypothetical protein
MLMPGLAPGIGFSAPLQTLVAKLCTCAGNMVARAKALRARRNK